MKNTNPPAPLSLKDSGESPQQDTPDERELPPGWAFANLGDLLSISQNGCGVRNGNNGVPTIVLRLADVNVEGRISTSNLREVLLSKEEVEKYSLSVGDLLVFRVNGSKSITGRVIHYTGPSGYAFCDHFIRLRAKISLIEPRFLALSFHSAKLREQVELQMVSTAGQNTVSQGTFAALSIPIPPLPEQRRIVAKLDELLARSRKAREALEAIPPLLEKLRQSILAAAFRGDLTAAWREKNPDVEPASVLLQRIRAERRKKWEEAELAKLMAKGKTPLGDSWKDKYQEPEPVNTEGLPELPEGWCWIDLDSLLGDPGDLFDGPFGSSLKSSDYQPSGARVVRLENVANLKFVQDKETFISIDKYQTLIKHSVGKDDIIFGSFIEDTTRVCVLPDLGGPAIAKADCFCIRPDRRLISSRILSFYLGSPTAHNDLTQNIHGATRPRINTGHLRKLFIPLPPLQEQAALDSILNRDLASINRRTEEYQTVLGALISLDGAILAKAFRGELVAQDPADEPAEVMLERLRKEQEQAPVASKRGRKPKEGGTPAGKKAKGGQGTLF